MSRRARRVYAWPFIVTAPVEDRPARRMESNVVFPDPLGPMSAVKLPAENVPSMPSKITFFTPRCTRTIWPTPRARSSTPPQLFIDGASEESSPSRSAARVAEVDIEKAGSRKVAGRWRRDKRHGSAAARRPVGARVRCQTVTAAVPMRVDSRYAPCVIIPHSLKEPPDLLQIARPGRAPYAHQNGTHANTRAMHRL